MCQHIRTPGDVRGIGISFSNLAIEMVLLLRRHFDPESLQLLYENPSVALALSIALTVRLQSQYEDFENSHNTRL